jgi:Flp pilus assembly protein TadD
MSRKMPGGRQARRRADKRGKGTPKPGGMPSQQEVNELLELYQSARIEALVTAARRFTRQWPAIAFGWNVLAEALRQSGCLEEAERACRKGLDADPSNAEAWSNLGNVLQQAGRSEEAEQALRKALRLKPRLAEAYFNLGNVLRDQGRPEEALEAYGRSEVLQPGAHVVPLNRAVLLRDLGWLTEAEAAYRKVLDMRAESLDAELGLVHVLVDAGRAEEAEGHCRRVIERAPEDPRAHDHLGMVLRSLGRRKEAEAAYRRAIELAPDDARRHRNLALVKRFVPDDPDLAAIERLLAAADPADPVQCAHLHYAAAKAREDLDDPPERVFAHYEAGAGHVRRTFDYDIAVDEARLARIGESWPAEPGAASGPGADPGRAPIFIVGMPRSGSTLVEQILGAHPRVRAGGERPDLGRIVASQEYEHRCSFSRWPAELLASAAEEVGRAYRAAVTDPVTDAERVTDKMPSNFTYLGLLAKALPESRVIHVRRTPADTCLSCFAQLFASGQAFTYDLDELGRYYRAYDALMRHWHAALDPGFLLEVRYEELVSDPETVVRRLLAHCGLEWDPACLDFSQLQRTVRTASAEQVRQPLYTRSIGRWQRYRDHLGPLFEALGDLAPE